MHVICKLNNPQSMCHVYMHICLHHTSCYILPFTQKRRHIRLLCSVFLDFNLQISINRLCSGDMADFIIRMLADLGCLLSTENTPVILDIKTGIDLAQEMLHSYTTDYFYSSIVEGLLTTWVDLAVLQDRHARLLHAGGTCTIILKIKLCACTIP